MTYRGLRYFGFLKAISKNEYTVFVYFKGEKTEIDKKTSLWAYSFSDIAKGKFFNLKLKPG
jgi:hypothetical protein